MYIYIMCTYTCIYICYMIYTSATSYMVMNMNILLSLWKAAEAFRRQLADLRSPSLRAAALPLRLAPAVFEKKSFPWREVRWLATFGCVKIGSKNGGF